MDKGENRQSALETIRDYITGKSVPLMGPEENRQTVERFLVEEKGYAKEDIHVGEKISVQAGGELYESRIDLVVYVNKAPYMAIKCAPGSLGSREREILAAARLVFDSPIPFSVVSDGKTAIVMDTVSGQKTGEGMSSIYSKTEAIQHMQTIQSHPLPKARKDKEALIFRSYDSMNVNRKR